MLKVAAAAVFTTAAAATDGGPDHGISPRGQRFDAAATAAV